MQMLNNGNSDNNNSDQDSEKKIVTHTKPQEQQNQNKIGKPKGMGNQKPLEKTGEWCSQMNSIKLLQILQRQGRFVFFQQTGVKKSQGKQNEYSDQNSQDQTCCNFLDAKTIQIAKIVADICSIEKTTNKNCVIFFFRPQPEIKIGQDGQLSLEDEIDPIRIEAPKQISPMLNKKFLGEFKSYLSCEPKDDEIKKFFEDENNKQLITAHTLLQAQFVNYLVKENQNNEELIQKSKDKETQAKEFKEKYQQRYNIFYEIAFTNFQQALQEIWACVYPDDENDRQYDQ